MLSSSRAALTPCSVSQPWHRLDCSSVPTPRNAHVASSAPVSCCSRLCGTCSICAVRGSRPDVANAVLRLGRRVSRNWSVVQDEAMHRLYCYLYHTRGLGLWLVFSPGGLSLVGFSDADHANDPENTARSTSAGVFFIRSAGGALMPIEWFSRTQTATARSTPEAEIVSLVELVFSAGLPMARTATSLPI